MASARPTARIMKISRPRFQTAEQLYRNLLLQRGETATMCTRISQPRRQHQRALEIQARVVFVGEADGSVQLDHLARDTQASVAGARLEAAGHAGSLLRRGIGVEHAH